VIFSCGSPRSLSNAGVMLLGDDTGLLSVLGDCNALIVDGASQAAAKHDAGNGDAAALGAPDGVQRGRRRIHGGR
jgi:hypothetical protein